MQQPLISVLIPSYNHARYIGETLASVFAQDYPQLEIVVTDDRSTDATPEVLQRLQAESPFPMTVVRNERQLGPAANCNRAFALCKGEYVSFLASDDLLVAGRYPRQVAALRDDRVQFVFGNGYLYDGRTLAGDVYNAKAVQTFRSPAEAILRRIYVDTVPFFLQGCLIRRTLFERVGGFDERLLADDLYLAARFFEHITRHRQAFVYSDDKVFAYRQHDTNIHKDFDRQSRLRLEFIENVVPAELRPLAYRKIVHKLAVQALKLGRRDDSLRLFRLSQSRSFDLPNLLRYAAKFVPAALRGRAE